ncbi:MAG: HAMP domain-containing sensor histidine kinase [Ruminiclostridium sp.]
MVLISAIGIVAVYIVSGKALKPLSDLNNAVIKITENNLEKHIAAVNTDDEIGDLTRSFNAMLDRLEQSFLRQKRFSANVAHELKTPLATINAGIQVLQLDENPTVADYQETLGITQRNIKRLINVVNDLLSLSNESLDESNETIDIKNMFKHIMSELQPLCIEKNIEASCEFELDTVKGNVTLVNRAFYNLVENAIKYNHPNSKVLIKTFFEEGTGKICISDTGIGIPKEDIDRIFEPFYCVDKSRSRKMGGAGLGLSIVKAITEKHRWSIVVNSTVDIGTTIIVVMSDKA